MLRTIFYCLIFYLIGIAGSSLYWTGQIEKNSNLKMAGILLSGAMLLIAILAIAIIKSFEDEDVHKQKDTKC